MNRTRHKRAALFFLTVLAVLIAATVGLTWRKVRQERLNRALIAAVKRNDDKAVVSILSGGANANSRDEETRHTSMWQLLYDRLRGKKLKASIAPSPVVLALTREQVSNPDGTVELRPVNVKLILALLEHGADPNARDRDNNTALLLAANINDFETDLRPQRLAIVTTLLAQGARVNAANNLGWTPLIAAASHCDSEVARVLLDHGADVNGRDKNGWSALIWAVSRSEIPYPERRLAAVKVLVKQGADVNVKGNFQGDEATPLGEANDSPRLQAILRKAGAKPQFPWRPQSS